ncbi:MAG: tRNA (guanosine(37)-N1)-methyltransferase TrmD [Gemmataceae bacterium]
MPVAAIRFDVLTLFPEMFAGFVAHGLLRQAIQNQLVAVHTWNFRDWSLDKHQKVDDRPFGGGPGMVLMADPIIRAVEAVQAEATAGSVLMMTPTGTRLTQRVVEELAEQPRLLILCGRYEGFDDRIRQLLAPRELSIGDFVCNGGEVPAMTVIDTMIRLIPGVLGDEDSARDDSHNQDGRLEFPQYTRPRTYRGLDVPDVLMSGNHAAVARWRQQQSALKSLNPNHPADRGTT